MLCNQEQNFRLILASGSPRRKELLSRMGYKFEIIVPDVDEKVSGHARDVVEVLSRRKAEAVAKIREICGRYKDEKTPLMMILSDIQNEYGYIPLDVQEIVSQETGISVAEIYGVVTFYSFFSLEPKGRFVVGCCLGTACYVKGAQQVIDKFQEELGIAPGQTTEDGMFTLDALRCIGACGIAPAVSINGKVYPKMTVSQVREVIAQQYLIVEKEKGGVTA
jgi:NADH-quinone oxidoreductase subunit E/NADP-reducing hydrogenase subunit HndA